MRTNPALGTRLVLLLLLLLAGAARGDSDYDSFMSSLSYNWQNEFVDLRYQLDDLQRNDPDQYNQLAASLGLKPGTKISVPSQYSPEWASKFVAAAHLYTPPAPSDDATQLPTPTSASADDSKSSSGSTASSHHTTSHGGTDDDHSDDGDSSTLDAEDDLDSPDGSSARSSSSTSKSKSRTSKTDGGSTQFGNPVVGSIGDGPIVPSGQGYSAAAALSPPGVGALLVLWLLVLSQQ
ncbi:hypothetical protein H4R21_005363 [Coemansia helicoidea]|uniref:Uncharacterized protein n=1 Tax=Coemansia helicoidea TaxID=1286919 RepID=A0ACC1KTG4_9FUNG|nr:hypothetical protein H4R21_005363 [Coemansia helicoidea]